MPSFAQYIGIDYSGAETPNANLKGLRVYLAEGDMAPVEVLPPPSPRKYWTRRESPNGCWSGWLRTCRRWSASTTASHSRCVFEVHRLKPDWSAFLDDFQRH
jgi:hypothetical protein